MRLCFCWFVGGGPAPGASARLRLHGAGGIVRLNLLHDGRSEVLQRARQPDRQDEESGVAPVSMATPETGRFPGFIRLPALVSVPSPTAFAAV